MKKIFSVCLILVFVSLVCADVKQDRSYKALKDYYDANRNSKKIGVDNRWTMNIALAGLALNISEQDNNWCSEKIAELFENQKTAFSEDKAPGVLYWALPQMCMLLASPEISPRVSEEAAAAMKDVLWDFAYTFDDISRAEIWPSGLLNVYVSDNHDVHKKGVFLLAAQIFKNDPDYAQRKYTDGTTAQKHYEAFCKHFMEYYRFRAQKGIDIEFGSAVYSGVHLQPLFAIYDCIEDKQIKEYTGKFIDLFFADVAQETINGMRGGAKVRMYKEPFTYSGGQDRLMCCNYILAGEPEKLPNEISFDSIIIAASTYRLPDMIAELMTNSEKKGSYSYITRRLGQGDHVLYTEHKYEAAPKYIIEHPSAVYRYSWCTPDYVLGWFAIDESRHYMMINSQNQWMGLITSENLDSRVVFQTTSPELMARRVSYRNLMVIGDKNSMLVRRQLASYGDELLMTYISNDFSLEEDKASGWIFGQNQKTFYALKPAQKDETAENGVDISQSPKYVIETKEGYNGRFVKYLHPSVMVVFEVASINDYKDFDAFKADMLDNKMQYINNWDEFEYYPSRGAAKLTMFADMKTPLIGGEKLDYFPKYTYDSPFMRANYDSTTVTITGLDGKTMVLNFDY